MSEYINKNAAMDGITSIAQHKARSDAQQALMGQVIYFLDHLPVLENEEQEVRVRKVGYWEQRVAMAQNVTYYTCSVCGAGVDDLQDCTPTCHVCNAEMRGILYE